jgi:hypothetical protein
MRFFRPRLHRERMVHIQPTGRMVNVGNGQCPPREETDADRHRPEPSKIAVEVWATCKSDAHCTADRPLPPAESGRPLLAGPWSLPSQRSPPEEPGVRPADALSSCDERCGKRVSSPVLCRLADATQPLRRHSVFATQEAIMNSRTKPATVLTRLFFSRVLWAATFAVSPTGQDSNPGRVRQPFATLERARDAARRLIVCIARTSARVRAVSP